MELWDDYETYYSLSLRTKSKLTELVHGKMQCVYLESFANHKEKFFKSNKSFLKPSRVYFGHYDPSAGKRRRRACYLNREQIVELRMAGKDYDELIKFLGLCVANKAVNLITITLSDLRHLLLESRFPESTIVGKIKRGLKAWTETSKLRT